MLYFLFFKKNITKIFFPELLACENYTNNDWHCIIHKNADLVLLVPKNYISKEMHSRPLTEQMTSCGFNINTDNFNIVKELSIKNLLAYLTTNIDNVDIVDGIKNLFIPSTMSSDTLSWNMYITGHGSPSYTKKMLVYNMSKNQLNRANGLYTKKKINQNLKLLEQAENFDDIVLIPDSGEIVGLITSDFLDLLSFFNKTLKMSFLHYATCYGTGTNLAIVADALNKANVNFIISCEGVTEHTSSSDKVASNKTNLINFFSQLCNFFNNPDEFITGLKANTSLSNNPIGSILQSIINFNEHALVRIPSIGIFTPTYIGNHIKILTNSIIKAHAFENKPLDCTNPEIKTIVLYSSYIGAPLYLNDRPGITLALPQNFQTVKKRKVCVFEKINYSNSINAFLIDLALNNTTRTHITFVIKQLECLDNNRQPVLIKNIIFSINNTKVLSLSSLYSEKIGFLSISNNNYRISHGDNNYIPSFLPLEKILPPELVSKVIDPEDMEGIAPEDMTLSTIVEQLEKKTSKDFAVQQPGSLQKVLERKIIESIGKRFPGSMQMLDEESQRIARLTEESRRQHSAEENRQQAAMKLEYE